VCTKFHQDRSKTVDLHTKYTNNQTFNLYMYIDKGSDSKKITFFFLTPIAFFFHSVPSLPYLFHLSYLPYVFTQYFFPLLFLLSFCYIHSTCALLSLSPHNPFCTFFPLLPSNTCFLSRHYFFLSCTLAPQVLRNFLCHTPFIFPVVTGFFNSLPSFLLVCVFVPFTQLYIHPSSFCS
jgi:hypothetical protein